MPDPVGAINSVRSCVAHSMIVLYVSNKRKPMSNETAKCNDQPASKLSCPDPAGSQIRELVLRLVHCGYQAGHNETVEGTFSDDPHGTDSEYIHGERVDEIIQDFSANGKV